MEQVVRPSWRWSSKSFSLKRMRVASCELPVASEGGVASCELPVGSEEGSLLATGNCPLATPWRCRALRSVWWMSNSLTGSPYW